MQKFEEIKINLPYGGHIAGKFYGDKSIRPFVCLHGWLDNAGSFDRLIPLLPQEYSYLAIDFPGHGRSSWLPNGVHYAMLNNLVILTCLMNEFKWNKISIIGHSMGSHISFMFSVLFPEKVDVFISIDILKTVNRTENWITYALTSGTDQFLLNDERQRKGVEPPAYSYEEAIERIVAGTAGGVTKEVAPILLERNIKESKIHPGKFYFSRDNRIKFSIDTGIPQDVALNYIKSFKVPYLVLKATHGQIFEDQSFTDEALEMFKKLANFEYHAIDTGSHHFHLTEPETIADVMSRFMRKYRPAVNHL